MCHLHWISSVFALVFIGVAGAADTRKDSAKPQTKEKIESSGRFIGELMSAEPTATKTFTVKITYYEIDPGKYQSLQQYIAQQNVEIRLLKPADKPTRLVQFQVEVAKRQADLYKSATKEVQLEATDAMKVRTQVLPRNFDDKGKPKKYTKKELNELKGTNKSLPGYSADYDSLQKGQIVEVYLAKKKARTRSKTRDDADKNAELLKEPPKVTMIVILGEKMEKEDK